MIGTVIGNYEIVAQAGYGGMGVVYEARHTQLGSRAAIKAVLDPDEDLEASRRRLEHEARLAASVTHPYVCRVHDIAEHDSQLYLVMEYVTGTTLSKRIRDDSLTHDDRLRITAELTEALSAIHDAGLVHGDLKPSNVMVGDDGHIKVMDFGLARRARVAISRESERSQLSTESDRPPGGTLPYMAPELMHGETPSAVSDLWALGVVAHEVWTGRHPFHGPTVASTTARVIGPEPTEDELHTSLAGHPWRQPLGRCLHRESSLRPRSARDLLQEVRRTPVPGLAAERRPRRAIAVAAGVALALVALAAVVWGLKGGAPDTPGNFLAVVPMASTTDVEARLLAMATSGYLSGFDDAQVMPFDRIRPLLASRDGDRRLDLPAFRETLGAAAVIAVDLEGDASARVATFRIEEGRGEETVLTVRGASLFSLARQASLELSGHFGLDDGPDDGVVFTEIESAIRDFERAQEHRRNLRYNDAIEALDAAVAADPDFLEARLLRARTHDAIGLDAEARREITELYEALDARGRSRTGRFGRFVTALHLRHTLPGDEAVVELESLCDADPSDLEACSVLLTALEERGQYERSLTRTDELLQRYPLDLGLRLDRITTLADLKRYDEAFEEAERLEQTGRLLSLDDLDGFLLEKRAYTTYRSGDYDEALALYQRARAAYERAGLTLRAYGPLKSSGDARIQLWRLDRAREDLLEALPLVRESGNLHTEARILNSLGSVNLRLRRLEDALADYAASDALAKRLDNFRYRYSANVNAASAYLLTGDLDRARRQLELTRSLLTQAEIDPDTADVLLRESDLARAEGRIDDAIAILEADAPFPRAPHELSRLQRRIVLALDAGADATEVAAGAVEHARELGNPARLAYTLDLAAIVAARTGDVRAARAMADESRTLLDGTPHGPVHVMTHEWATVERLAAEDRWADLLSLEVTPPTPGSESFETHRVRILALRRLGRLDEAQALRDTIAALPWVTEEERRRL